MLQSHYKFFSRAKHFSKNPREWWVHYQIGLVRRKHFVYFSLENKLAINNFVFVFYQTNHQHEKKNYFNRLTLACRHLNFSRSLFFKRLKRDKISNEEPWSTTTSLILLHCLIFKLISMKKLAAISIFFHLLQKNPNIIW